MGITYAHALGRERKFFVMPEVTNGTPVKATTTGAAKVTKSAFTLEQSRMPRMDSRQTATLLERITGKGKVTWSVDAEVIPSGVAGTAPDLHDLYYAAFGSTTNTPATSQSYALSDAQTPLLTTTMYHEFSSVVQELVYGAWVEELKFSGSGGDVPKVSFSGGAMGYSAIGTSTLNGAIVSSTTAVVQTADAQAFQQYGIIKIGSDTNSGAGYRINTASSTPSLTLDTSLSASNAAAVVPYLPSETTAGTPLAAISGSIVFGSVTFPCTAFELSLKTGIKSNEDEALVQFPNELIKGWREVSGSISFRWRKDLGTTILKRAAYGTAALVITMGSVAGKRAVLTCPYAEIDFATFEFPEADEATVTVPFVALGSAGADELTLAFT